MSLCLLERWEEADPFVYTPHLALTPPNALLPLVRWIVAIFAVALLPLGAEAQVLDTLNTTTDSTDYEVETYFVKVDTTSFFKPHHDEEAVQILLDRTGRGQCRVVTVVRAIDQRRAATLAERYSGAVINTRLIVRCAPTHSTRILGALPPTLTPAIRNREQSFLPQRKTRRLGTGETRKKAREEEDDG